MYTLWLIFSLYIPYANAEVIDLQTNLNSFTAGDSIIFSGHVDPNSKGLVTIVIRDMDDNFVLLVQAITDEKYFFEKNVSIDEKFTKKGLYHATGFILSMTEGAQTDFLITENEITTSAISEESDFIIVEPPIAEPPIAEPPIADFIDPNKDPQYYLNRYYNEPSYKSWFDRNYPKLTIEEAVGHVGIIEQEKKNCRITSREKYHSGSRCSFNR